MEPQTSKKDYRNHKYSGPRKSRKRSYGQMKRYHGEIKSRTEVWCKKKEPKNNVDVPSVPVPSSSLVDKPTIKTYGSSKKRNHTEAENNLKEQPKIERVPSLEFLDINCDGLKVEVEHVPDNLSGLSGNRIVDLPHVLQWAFKLERHRSQCEGASISFVEELKNGFNSTFLFQCSMCGDNFQYCNENVEKVNKAFVWGTLIAGSCYTQAAHITNMMDIPTISAQQFCDTEISLGDTWKDHLTEEIQKNGEQEKAIAIKKKQVDANGIPYVTVHVGWPEQSSSHDYSSPSGMACIIGKETKNCLFIGIKNKYCYHCHVSKKKNEPMPDHKCFENYDGPSKGMESAIIVEGFQKSQEMHGVLYLNFIGDGDSSVYAQLREEVSYGEQIKMIECKNHVVKNYTDALHKILTNKKLPLFGRNLLNQKLHKLAAVTRKIIMKGACESMNEDLRNGPFHIFGCHKECKTYYCGYCDNNNVKDTDSLQDFKTKAPAVWTLICAANEAVISKGHLLSNDTTNFVENIMSFVSKFVCEKR